MAEDRAIVAPATPAQPSRKGKKAWRKNVDISEVERGLDHLETAKIHGGVVAEMESGDLFITDTAGDDKLVKKSKLLKAEEILALRSSVPHLEGRKRKAPPIPEGSSKRVKDGRYVTHKDLQRIKAAANNAPSSSDLQPATHDPWSTSTVPKADPRFTFLDANITRTNSKTEPKTLKEPPVPLTATTKAPKPVPRPSAGKSYNPLVNDWSALLTREGEAAVEAETQRLALEAETDAKQARLEAEAAKAEAAEKDQGDYDSAWESEWEGFVSGGEEVHTTRLKGRKTPAERNKVKARKEREAEAEHAKKLAARREQESRIKAIAREVSAKDRARQANLRALSRAVKSVSSNSEDEDEETPELQRRRFGKVAVPQAPLEVVLPEELEDSLRRLKPEGDLMADRYRHLLVSGKVEVRKRAGERRKAKTTRTEKWGYKDWKLR